MFSLVIWTLWILTRCVGGEEYAKLGAWASAGSVLGVLFASKITDNRFILSLSAGLGAFIATSLAAGLWSIKSLT